MTMDLLRPFTARLDEATGRIDPADSRIERRLAEMQGAYLDDPQEDALVYEVFNLEVPQSNANILSCTTVLQPGKVGREYFMTKGHWHEIRDRAEVYVGFKGKGALILATEDGEHDVQWMEPGTVHYIPGGWAHRSVNVGDVPLVFYAAWIADAGHDYGSIERRGFPVLLVDNDGTPDIVPNPRYAAAS
jgi:glucose-6-phosphate isomerase